jgi:hypothetical protein
MAQRYEIYRKLGSREAVCVGTVATLNEAQTRVRDLERISQAEYFIYDVDGARFIAPRDSAGAREYEC